MGDQLKVLDKGVDVLIATPGRLLDVFERGFLLMTDVRTLVIDEADRMLDMGFIPDVERIVSLLSPMRTTLLFSATMPPEIRKLATKFLSNPKEITVSKPASTAETISQKILLVEHNDDSKYGSGQKEKRNCLRQLILEENPKNALIFCNRKRDVDIVWRSLKKHGFNSDRLHGDMDQGTRMETLEKFKSGLTKFMVCSDVAARGLDIPEMTHVFNFDVPTHPDDYVHRIGRTGRAGNVGVAITLCTTEDTKYISAITKIIGQKLPIIKWDIRKNNIPRKGKQVAVSSSKVEKEEKAGPHKPKRKSLNKPKKVEIEKSIAIDENNYTKTTQKGLGDHVPAFFKAQF